ncbi:SWIM-type domain-containing protein [Citrus sinensis]|uniref:SWIM-type domain-containing protein n=1 Tax=Citrus sinensis TaxID=2711 RepID=A0ACB8MCK8_CITSI|nr:SWIM-type domain-containing protein [Citrus sinensis]
MVLQRKLSFEEKFKLTLTQPWDNDCTNICSDDDLFSVWSLYNHYGYYEIHLDLEIISKPATSSTRKSLFQQPLINATTENISPENPTAINLNVPVNEAQTSDILMKLVPHDQLNTQPSLIHSNASLYKDFVNTFEKSPTSHQRSTPCNSNATQQMLIEEGDNEDSNLRLCFPSDQHDDEFQQNTEQPQLHVQVTHPNIGESDDDVDDCLLSDYESDNNEFGPCADEDGDRVMEVMDAEVKANMYISSDEPVEFFVGQYFRNFTELAIALRKFVVYKRFKTRKDKFERTRISVGCEGYMCHWYLHAGRTVIRETFMVKRYHNVHTCTRLLKNPECTANELNRMYGVKVDKQKVYRAKKIALESGGADFESNYRLIRSYAQIILNKMPDALAIVHVVELHGNQVKTHFDRCIISFPSLKKGFKEGCRPFIGIDGCHLKGPYKGILLSAVALDANTGIYPIVVCVCNAESTNTWTWFLGHLKEYMKDSRQLTFMCDRQKGIQNALRLEYPNAHVRFCARHLLANLKSKHPRTNFKGGFWEAARAANQIDFERAMEKIKSADAGAYETLRKVHPRFWSRHAFDKTSKSDHCTNNMTESFNAWLGEQRKLPLLTLLNFIKKKMMKRMITRKKKAEAWPSEISRRVYEKMQKNLQLSRGYVVAPASEWLYEVESKGRTYIYPLMSQKPQSHEWCSRSTERRLDPLIVAQTCLFVSCEVCIAPLQIWYRGTSLSPNAKFLLLLVEIFGVAGLLLCFGAYWFQRKQKTSGVMTHNKDLTVMMNQSFINLQPE